MFGTKFMLYQTVMRRRMFIKTRLPLSSAVGIGCVSLPDRMVLYIAVSWMIVPQQMLMHLYLGSLYRATLKNQ